MYTVYVHIVYFHVILHEHHEVTIANAKGIQKQTLMPSNFHIHPRPSSPISPASLGTQTPVESHDVSTLPAHLRPNPLSISQAGRCEPPRRKLINIYKQCANNIKHIISDI